MKKILLAEDSTAIRNILKTALFEEYEILEAENGKAAYELAIKNQVNMFLLDLNMPVMDGIELLKALRKLPQYEKTPMIMLTTEVRDEKRQEGKAAGANGWITKPCDPDKLLHVIKKLI